MHGFYLILLHDLYPAVAVVVRGKIGSTRNDSWSSGKAKLNLATLASAKTASSERAIPPPDYSDTVSFSLINPPRISF